VSTTNCKRCGRPFHVPPGRRLCRKCARHQKNCIARVRLIESLGGRQLPETPTEAAPHTEEKIRVLEERAAQGLALHHPADAKRLPDLPPKRLPRGILGPQGVREPPRRRVWLPDGTRVPL
jgi:hypothetical protein